MAIAFNPGLDQDDEEQNQKKSQTAALPQQTGGGLMGTGGGSAQPSQPQAKGSGAFVNLQKYLQANEGRSEQMAGDVGGYVGGEAEKGKSALSGAETSFTKDVQGNTLTVDDSLVSRATESPWKLSEGDQKNLSKLYGGSYQGPTDFSDYDGVQDAAGQIEKANTLVGLTGEAGGRKTLLSDLYNTGETEGRYTAGLKNFDNLLITRDPEAQQSLSSLRDRYKGIMDLVGEASSRAEGMVKSAQDTSTETRKKVSGAVDSAWDSLAGGINQRVTDTNADRESAWDTVQGRLSKTPSTVKKVLGADPSSYVTRGRDASWTDVITDDEQRGLSALAGISGKENIFTGDRTKLDDPFTFDRERWDSDIARNTTRSKTPEPTPQVKASAPPSDPTPGSQVHTGAPMGGKVASTVVKTAKDTVDTYSKNIDKAGKAIDKSVGKPFSKLKKSLGWK